MKVVRLEIGETIDIGDALRTDNPLTGQQWFRVVKVTPKFAVVAWNEVGRGTFPRIVNNRMKPRGQRDIWSQTQYSFWREKEARG